MSEQLLDLADLLPPAEEPARGSARATPAPTEDLGPASNLGRSFNQSSQGLLDLAELLPPVPTQQQAPSRARGEKSLMGDIGTLFYSSMLDTLASGVAAGEYMAGSGGTLTRWRESLSEAAREAQKGVSQEMQAALSRRFIPSEDDAPSAYKSFGDFFGAVGAQAVASLGSIVASLPAIGVGIAGGGPVGGMLAGGATTGLLGMGTVWKDTAEAFQQIPEEERRRLNAGYVARRDAGMDPAQAIDETVREAAGRYPEIAGILSALPGAVMGRFEAQLGGRQLRQGITRTAGRGALIEGGTELPEEVTQNVATQLATERLTGEPFRVSEAAEAGVRGFIGGAGMGGAMGAIGGAFQRGQPEPTPTGPGVDPSLSAAVNPAPTPAPTTPSDTGVDPSISAAVASTTQAPTTPPTLAPLAQSTTTATMSATPDPLGAAGFVEQMLAQPEQAPTSPAAPEAPPTPETALTQEPTGAVERAIQSPIEMLRSEGIDLADDSPEAQRFKVLESDKEKYKAFIDCLRGKGK